MQTQRSSEVYVGRRLRVRDDEVRQDDGTTEHYEVVVAPDIALVIPVEGDRVMLVEQYRHPVGGRRWELPSGTFEPTVDADPAALAARELREETGLAAGALTPLGTLEITPSTFTQHCFVYLARDLTHGVPRPDAEEADLGAAWFARSEIEAMMRDGRVTDAKSMAAYALLLLAAESG